MDLLEQVQRKAKKEIRGLEPATYEIERADIVQPGEKKALSRYFSNRLIPKEGKKKAREGLFKKACSEVMCVLSHEASDRALSNLV